MTHYHQGRVKDRSLQKGKEHLKIVDVHFSHKQKQIKQVLVKEFLPDLVSFGVKTSGNIHKIRLFRTKTGNEL